ncbi:hypothetical protein L211DRAFT_832925 [Terfezia boudieri ATCC MYA-4762]|uniref:Uncharacterized protein n=1 Tax=Terfezia boudieri ATCC MYA-4762 TaxID=1051890 RepID=A0A3N4MLR1_9PEZI|nr:hypothetical protein L211DRAFT_832925 [Terfezia boudieri ATCC MYA-4762]
MQPIQETLSNYLSAIRLYHFIHLIRNACIILYSILYFLDFPSILQTGSDEKMVEQ